MPIYEYECPDCGKIFEALQKYSDAPLTACPHCSGVRVRKRMSLTTFVLKGSGWYVTDYARKGNTAKEAKPSATSTTPESKSTDASSSKTEGGSSTAKEAKAAA